MASPDRVAKNKQYGGNGLLEFWPSSEEGTPEFPAPSKGKNVIEVYSDDLKNNPDKLTSSAFRDALHVLPEKDAKWQQLRSELVKATPPEYFDKWRRNTGDKRNLQDFINKTGADGLIRGAFDEDSEFGAAFRKEPNYTYQGKQYKSEPIYSDKQREILNKMRDYLGVGAPHSQTFSDQLNDHIKAYEGSHTKEENAAMRQAQSAPVEGKITKDNTGFWTSAKRGATKIASMALQGGLDLAEAGTYLYDKAHPLNPITTTPIIEHLREPANLGLSKEYEGASSVERGLAGLAQFTPAVLASESTGGASLFLQGAGNAAHQVEELKKQGAEFKNHSDDAHILMSGMANYFLLKGLPISGVLSKLPAPLRESIVGRLSLDALKEVGEKPTAEALAQTAKDVSVKFADRLKSGGIKFLENYAKTAKDLTGLQVADYASKAISNKLSGNENFHQDPEQLVEGIKRVFTTDAPIFAGLGSAVEGIKDKGALFRQSQYKNQVVESLRNGSDIEQIKKDLQDHGAEQGWSEKEIVGSLQAADELHQAVKAVPKEFGEAKTNKAVDLITGRKELEDHLAEIQTAKEGVDAAVREIPTKEESLVQAKLDQSNDKLRELASDQKYRYNFDEEKGKYTKQLGENGKPEEISKDRYELEQLEKEFKKPTGPLAKAEDDLSVLKQVSDKTKKYEGSMKRLTEAKNAGQITEKEFNEMKGRFDDVMKDRSIETEQSAPAEEDVTPSIEETRAEPLNAEIENKSLADPEQEIISPPEAGESDSINTEEPPISEEPTAIRNEDIAAKRRELGMEERPAVEHKANEDLVKEAKTEIDNGYDVHDLMDRLSEGDKISDKETVILKQYQLQKENHLIDLNDKIVKATQEGKASTIDKFIQERDQAIDDLQRSFDVGEKAGTEIARALQARKIELLNDYSLANMLIRKRTAKGGEKLSSEEFEHIRQNYEHIKDLNDKLQATIDELNKNNSDVRAEEAFRRLKKNPQIVERRYLRTEKRQDIDKDISDTLDALKKKIKAQSGILSVNPIPVEAIGDIAKLAQLYTKKGLLSIEEVVDTIYDNLKDSIEGLDKEHIKEVIGSYDYETASKEESRLKGFKTRTEAKTREYRDRVNRGDYSKRKIEPIKLDKEGTELRDELRKAKHDYEVELYKDELNRRTKGQKIRDAITEVINVPRALMASVDYSAPLRQGLVETVAHPILASKAFVEMFRQSISQKRFDTWLDDLKESPAYELMKKNDLYIADPRKPKLEAKEEQFMSNLADKIPVIGKLVKGSERAYVAYLNKLRTDVFMDATKTFMDAGKTPENNPELYKGLAKFINNATGRGSLGKLEESAQILNTGFFSPRLIASRINMLNPLFYAKLPKEIRVKAIGDMLKLIATGTTVLALAKAGGAQVEDDPRSTDFGKIKVGDTRYDIWGGFQQYVRLYSQLTPSIVYDRNKGTWYGRIKTSTDKLKDLTGEQFPFDTDWSKIEDFGYNKLAPVPAAIKAILSRKNAIGKKTDASETASGLITPLMLKDAYEAVKTKGVSGIYGSIPGVFGVGMQTYKK